MRRRATFFFLLTACAWAVGAAPVPPPSEPPLSAADLSCVTALVQAARTHVQAADATWDEQSEAAGGDILRELMGLIAADSTAAGQKAALELLWRGLAEKGAFQNTSQMADITAWLEDIQRQAEELLAGNTKLQGDEASLLRPAPTMVQPLLNYVGQFSWGRRFLPSRVNGNSLTAAEVGVDAQIDRTAGLIERLQTERVQWRENADRFRAASRLFGAAARRARAARDQLPAGSPQHNFFRTLAASLADGQQLYLVTATFVHDGAERCMDTQLALNDSLRVFRVRTKPNLLRLRGGQTILAAVAVAEVNHTLDSVVQRAADLQDVQIAERLRALTVTTIAKLSTGPYDLVLRDETTRLLQETEELRVGFEDGEDGRRDRLIAETEAHYARARALYDQRAAQMTLDAAAALPEVTEGGANAPRPSHQ